MPVELAALPHDVETLPRMIGVLVQERDSARAEAEAEIARQKQILRSLQRLQFGRRSEQLDPDQLELELEDVGTDLAAMEEASCRSLQAQDEPAAGSGQRPVLPDHLPREDRTIEVQAEACPCCGGVLHLVGESVSDMLDHVPAWLRVISIRRPKYGCRSCGSIHQSPAPERPDRSRHQYRRTGHPPCRPRPEEPPSCRVRRRCRKVGHHRHSHHHHEAQQRRAGSLAG